MNAALSAIDYAPLVGLYVDMERPATSAERLAGQSTVGMRCVVESVHDGVTHEGEQFVEIVADYGLSYRITAADRDDWRFSIRAEQAS